MTDTRRRQQRLLDVDPTDTADLPAQLASIASAAVADAAADGVDIRVSYQLATPTGALAGRAVAERHYAASTMKLPLVLAAYRRHHAGTLDLDSTVTVHPTFTSRTGSSFAVDREDDGDPEVWAAEGSPVSLRWLARRAIIRSSNLATNLLLEAVGFDAVAAAIAACGATDVRVVRMINDYKAEQAGLSNQVTVAGLNAILLAIADGTAADPACCAQLLDVLAANEVDTDVAQGLPPGTWIAHKNGWVSDTVLDAALVRPSGRDQVEGQFVLSAAVSGRWPNEKAHELIGRLAAAVWAARVTAPR